ncbi:MAG: hypothetical protein FWD23_15595 [Oscillospiraceae bacterium]|nr:hypothetical protein [Oscillospiraceae bacterium]
MPKFLINIVRDFLNIYIEEDKIRESFGNEYADRYSNRNPKTGKKIVSGLKVFTRIFIVFILALCIFYLVRILNA